MIEFTIKPEGLDAALRVRLAGERLANLDKKLLRSLSERIQKAVSDRSRYTFDSPSGSSGTGVGFCESWRRRTLGEGEGSRIILYNDSPQAGWLTGGTGIFGPSGKKIYPRTKGALFFFWYKANTWVTTRSVKGVNPYAVGSHEYNLETDIRKIIDDEVDAFIRDDVPDVIRRAWYGNE